jgi:hypothetical protein
MKTKRRRYRVAARLRRFYRSSWAWPCILLLYSFGFTLMYPATH